MDTNVDMDLEYGSTWSVDTLYITVYPYGHGYDLHVHILSLLHTLDIKIDRFKIGTIVFILVQGF